MAMRTGMFCVLAIAALGFACTSSSSSGGSSGDGGAGAGSSSGGGSSGAGTVTFSCTIPPGAVPDLCTEVVAPPSAMAGELQACNTQMGTFGTGCSMSGVVGCCVHGVSTQCAYSTDEAMVLQPLCVASQGKTWTTPDGGSGGGVDGGGGAGAFVGTWTRSGTQTVTCPMGGPTTNDITGDIMITRGSDSDSITTTQADGCVTNFTVMGDVATAAAGQTCDVTTEAGVHETMTVIMRTLTLSADGMTLMQMGSETIDKTATMTMCTSTSSGTYSKVTPL